MSDPRGCASRAWRWLAHLVCIEVPAGLAAALVPPHVLAEVLFSDDPAIHRPLVSRAFVGQSSKAGGGDGVGVDPVVADLLVALSVGGRLREGGALAAVAPCDLVHALHHPGLQALPAGR